MRRKGFTLIELLAIIVLLAIVALIATPQILRLIENGQKNSFLRSVEGIVRTVRLDNSKNEYFSDNYTITNGIIKNSSGSIIKHEGGKNENGIVSIDEDGKVSYTIYDGKWIANKNYDTEEMDVKNYSEAEVNSSIVTVSFDANGGNVSTTNKTVRVNSNYGELPTPTRPGYTFKGWSGKNMISDTEIRNHDNWKIDVVTQGGYPTNYGNPGFLLDLEVGKTYTISITVGGAATEEIPPYLYLCKKVDNEGYLVSYLTTTRIAKLNYTFEVKNGEEYFLRMGGNSGNESYFNTNISRLTTVQLEEGDEATPYEPYYVTSNVKVTQNKNHTLKAIWEKNE